MCICLVTEMDLAMFPLEVLEVLVCYLSAQDLAACSAVSLQWRDAFNLDLFWRRYCEDNIVHYMRRELNVVEPLFRTPRNLTALDSLCEWRVHCMRKAHLLRNWNKGRCISQKVQFQSVVVNCALGIDSSSNHWLIVNLGERTELWNVQKTPVFYATVGNITGAPNTLEIVGDKLLIIDCFYLVQVFHLHLPTLGFAPSSKFFYDDSESFFIDLSDDEERAAIRNRLRTSFRKGHVLFIADNFLVGYSSYVDDPKEHFLHIWDITVESKYSEESVENALQNKIRTYSCSVVLSSDLQTKRLLCSLYLLDRYVSKLVLYNLRTKRFLDFAISVSGKVDWCDISGGLVATSHLLHQLHIYCAYSGNLLNILDTNTRMIFGPNSGLQNQMLGPYMVQPSRESVKVINIQDHYDHLLLYFYSVYKVVTIPPYFLAVSARPYASSNKVILEVWNVKLKTKIFDNIIIESNCPAYHSIQTLLTKTAITVGNTVKLLSFW